MMASRSLKRRLRRQGEGKPHYDFRTRKAQRSRWEIPRKRRLKDLDLDGLLARLKKEGAVTVSSPSFAKTLQQRIFEKKLVHIGIKPIFGDAKRVEIFLKKK